MSKLDEKHRQEIDERLFFNRSADIDIIERPASAVDAPAREVAPIQGDFRVRFLAARTAKFTRNSIDIEGAHGTGFLFIPVLMIIGSIIYFSLPSEPALHNIPAGLIFLVSARLLLRRAPLFARTVLNAALIVVASMGLAQFKTHLLSTPMLGSEVSSRLTGKIVAIEARANGSVRYTIDVIKTERPKLRYAPDRIRATARKPLAGATIGGGIHGYVRLRPPSGPARPGAYDFAFYNYFAGIGANGFFLGAPQVVDLADSHQSWSLRIKVEQWRLWLAKRIQAVDDSRASAVSAALITGHKARIDDDVTESLRVSGLAHILSISGLHMALVAGTVMFALRAAFAASPGWAAGRGTKKIAALAGLGAIFIYLFLAGASVATQRSFIMLAVMIGALFVDKSALTMRNLAIAAILVILIAPEAVLGPSFQMSFAATLALIASYAAWTRWRHETAQYSERADGFSRALITKTGQFIGGLSMTSIVAGTATGLFAAYHFHRIAVFGLAGNLLAMPIVSLITMPSAIVATLFIPFGLDGHVYRLMNWSVEQVILIATFVAVRAPDGGTGALAASGVLWASAGIILICLLRSRLRLLGLACLVPAFLNFGAVERPLLVVSEDAKQVAVLTGDGVLAVNRNRPNAFTLKQWRSAYQAHQIVKPNTAEDAFECVDEELCSLKHPRTGQDLHIISEPLAEQGDYEALCGNSAIIIEAYAPAVIECHPANNTTIITAQMLALYGFAEVYNVLGETEVRHALGAANRPWHEHRKFSRSARNLAPYKRN